ncbi:unnamed protein product [Dovyalis caffra]|uniref:Non-haem dioxygenase N-terminal domain-containing protein n=1 Tax=Dovyalis caffra TaxID=77055 RepID=A0AAV1RH73_9ROSI|nr:unnamed protein product [Dovyalis caffra]
MTTATSRALLYKTHRHHRPLFHHFAGSRSHRILSRRIACQVKWSSTGTAFPTLRSVTIPYSDLQNKNADLSEKIVEGFGPNGLGILSISDVPGFSLLRQNLLHLSSRLANLPQKVKDELEDPRSRYNFGWSHGKEKLESGKPDMLKGSFYANPILDVPTTDICLIQRYPSYCASNIWPDSALPELEVVSRGMGGNQNKSLEQILLRSRCHKGRLLYYFPALNSDCVPDGDSMSSWCGWHTDHGSLTGLTCAMFKRDGVETICPDSAAGLYVKTRTDQIVKVVFGEDEIAYQIGETTEIMSRGYLCATPHCVRAPKGDEASGLDRSTFALFMQPDWDEKLNFPSEMHVHKELLWAQVMYEENDKNSLTRDQGNTTMAKTSVLGNSLMLANSCRTFGEYSEMLLDKYYHLKS